MSQLARACAVSHNRSMCTIIVALAVWPDRPLIVAANRDEALGRPADSPRLRRPGELGARAMIAGRDLVAGGTWLGLGESGVVVALTNRRVGATDRQRRSRGELVTRALDAGDRARAIDAIAGLAIAEFNPFHLLIADRGGAELLWSEGTSLNHVSLSPGVHWLTERGFCAGGRRVIVGPSVRHATLDTRAAELVAGPEPSLERWRTILADHEPHARAGEALDPSLVGLDAVCVHAQSLGYGTRSSTVVRLAGPRIGAEFFHTAGPACLHPFEDLSEQARLLGVESGSMLSPP